MYSFSRTDHQVVALAYLHASYAAVLMPRYRSCPSVRLSVPYTDSLKEKDAENLIGLDVTRTLLTDVPLFRVIRLGGGVLNPYSDHRLHLNIFLLRIQNQSTTVFPQEESFPADKCKCPTDETVLEILILPLNLLKMGFSDNFPRVRNLAGTADACVDLCTAGVVENSSHRKILPTRSSTG